MLESIPNMLMLCQIKRLDPVMNMKKCNSSGSIVEFQKRGTTGISRKISIRVVELSEQFFEKLP